MTLASLLMLSLIGPAHAEPPTTLVLSIEGMTCQGCSEGLQAKLTALDFVDTASASFQTQKACVVLSAALDEKALRKAIERKGAFKLTGTESVAACPAEAPAEG